MQGSAPLKNQHVWVAFCRLKEAFTRNERHEPSPVFAFVLSDECDSYTEYLAQRIDFLQSEGLGNPEMAAYDATGADDVAIKLDRDLSLIEVPKRTRSVSKAFRANLLATLHSGEVDNLHDETAQLALRRVNEKSTIQTFSLIESLGLADAQQLNAIYSLVRETYRRANAFGSTAINSDSCVQFHTANLFRFFDAIGLRIFIDDPDLITPEVLFKLRQSDSMSLLVTEYFKSQEQQDLDELFAFLGQFRVSDKLRKLLKQSPGAAAAMIFEELKQAQMGNNTLIKGIEYIAKAAMGDAFDDGLAQRYHRMFNAIEALQKELSRIISSRDIKRCK